MPYKHELIIPNEDLPFKIFEFEGKQGGYIREKHWHRSIEIFSVYEGTIDFYLNEERTVLGPGDFVIVNSNEVHSIRSPRTNRTIVVQIPFQQLERYYTRERFIWFSHGERKYDTQVSRMIREMYQVYEKKEEGYDLQVQSMFYELEYLLITRYRKLEVEDELVKSSMKLNRLSGITAYIRDNYQEDITLEGLADIFGYSPTYLSRMFQKYAQVTYRDYLQSVRLEYACRELTDRDKSIGQIAVDNGFADSRAFAKAFRKKYQMVPSEYRKRSKESAEELTHMRQE